MTNRFGNYEIVRNLEDRIVAAADYEDCEGDIQYVANAYLADHPADEGEPITDGWLREIGFIQWNTSEHIYSMRFLKTNDELQLWRQSGSRMTVKVFGVTLKSPVEARGQLRKLLEALGVETKENKGA